MRARLGCERKKNRKEEKKGREVKDREFMVADWEDGETC
jgi:hypothetical protein